MLQPGGGLDRGQDPFGAERGAEAPVEALAADIVMDLGRQPTDLVGAIANEAKIDASRIGTIEITDNFSLVELPEELVEPVIKALRATTIKGKRQTVRRDQATRRGG